MPYYLYKCKKCGREIEIEHGIKEEARTHHKHIRFNGHGEACNGRLKRLIAGGTSFRLTGSGWTGKGS